MSENTKGWLAVIVVVVLMAVGFAQAKDECNGQDCSMEQEYRGP